MRKPGLIYSLTLLGLSSYGVKTFITGPQISRAIFVPSTDGTQIETEIVDGRALDTLYDGSG